MTIFLILDWIFYGLIRYVLVLIPLVKAPRVYKRVPIQWWFYNGSWDWDQRNADNGHPSEHWCRSWLEMAFGELRRLATDKARPYVDQVKSYLIGKIGYVKGDFGSMGSWVNFLQSLVGSAVPFFAVNLTGAASWLYYKLPPGVRQGWRSWDQTWDWIKASIRSWAESRYESARSWAFDAIRWVQQTGDDLRRWRDRVAHWIDRVQSDPYGYIVGYLGSAWAWLAGFASNGRATVLGWLGPEWPKLVTFGRDCVSFYYNLWSMGWETLGDFVTDPRAFLMDRLETAIMDRW